jgi:nickel-dependent lactate racemase
VHKIQLTINGFYGDNELELSLPAHWDVDVRNMAGHGLPGLTDDQIRERLATPIGTPPLRELARGKKEVVIVFDDLPKPTRTDKLAPLVIEELHAAGITDEHIRFIVALGTHRMLTQPEFAVKLGWDIVQKYMVYNHSIWENLVFKGNTTMGTPVYINQEFDACDLRIGIGSLMPHVSAGFGGGGKIIMPGVSGMETIKFHHTNKHTNAQLGRVDDNTFRLDMEEVARMAGLHFKVDVIVNEKREAIGLFCGDFVEEHREAVKLARQTYVTELGKDADIVISNSYPDEPQIVRAYWPVPATLKDGGDLVVLTHFWEGQNLQGLVARYGTEYGGVMWKPRLRANALAKASRVFIMAPFMSKYDLEESGPAEKLVWRTRWDDILAELVGKHGAGTKVVVYPYTALQMPQP